MRGSDVGWAHAHCSALATPRGQVVGSPLALLQWRVAQSLLSGG
ncbi:hypothetical protein chiPu_0025446, partial [Chiloscyllium punctatum]|nr:hypothetical protein [Chiloscyllium punctatum]